jgi:exonuclease 3'-5' domain-containing protein 1
MAVNFVDTLSEVQTLVTELMLNPPRSVNLFLDLEGISLSRDGTISILTLHNRHRDITYLIDVTTLGMEAFNATPSSIEGEHSLKSILEDPHTIKVFFDVRNDSDALFHLYGINLAGIHDLQLMELAARPSNRLYLCGLAKCVDRDAGLSDDERQTWQQVKENGMRLFLPEKGGARDAFDLRPLPDALKEYCVQDVVEMPTLYRFYCLSLCNSWLAKIEQESCARVSLSHTEDYLARGPNRGRSPREIVKFRPGQQAQEARSRVIALLGPDWPPF